MKTTAALIMVMGMTLTGSAFAAPIPGTIGSAGNFSVIHDGANPGGTGDAHDWRWFDVGQQIDLILENGILTLNGEQTFSLNIPSAPQASALVTFREMSLNLNDPNDGFAGGHIDYTLDGTLGTFTFADHHYGSSPFNSTEWAGNEFTVYVWGGDEQNALGIDLALTVVPEPGVIALFMLGLAGVIVLRRRAMTGPPALKPYA